MKSLEAAEIDKFYSLALTSEEDQHYHGDSLVLGKVLRGCSNKDKTLFEPPEFEEKYLPKRYLPTGNTSKGTETKLPNNVRINSTVSASLLGSAWTFLAGCIRWLFSPRASYSSRYRQTTPAAEQPVTQVSKKHESRNWTYPTVGKSWGWSDDSQEERHSYERTRTIWKKYSHMRAKSELVINHKVKPVNSVNPVNPPLNPGFRLAQARQKGFFEEKILEEKIFEEKIIKRMVSYDSAVRLLRRLSRYV